MKIVTIEDVCQRISNKYPGQNFEIIEYTRVSKPFQIKCGQCSLKERQLRDKIKKEEAIKNNFHFLEISYIDYKNIEQILDSWFNDYSEKEVDSSESKQ